MYILAIPCIMCDLNSPTRDRTGALQWKHKVLTTGPLGKSLDDFLF